MSTAGNAPSLFHITRCAQNRLPREQPAPAPNSEPAAITLCSPYCLANVPRTPQRTLRPHPRAHTRSIRSPVPEKTSLSCATRSPALTHPTPHTTHVVPTSAPFLPTNPPQSRNFANPLETPAHPCYPRPREGPTPRPGNPYPHTGKAPGIVGTSKTGHRPAPCPTLSHGATFVSQQLAPGITDWSRTGDTLSYESHRMSQKLTEFAVPSSREQRSWGHPVI